MLPAQQPHPAWCSVLSYTSSRSSTGMRAETELLEVAVREGISHGILYPREVACHDMQVKGLLL